MLGVNDHQDSLNDFFSPLAASTLSFVLEHSWRVVFFHLPIFLSCFVCVSVLFLQLDCRQVQARAVSPFGSLIMPRRGSAPTGRGTEVAVSAREGVGHGPGGATATVCQGAVQRARSTWAQVA